MKKGLLIIIVLLCISGCSEKAKEKAEKNSNNETAIASTLTDNYYPSLKLETNVERQELYHSIPTVMDMKKIGRELQRLSVPYFSVDSYSCAEGQILTTEDYGELLGRKSETENAYSLQPLNEDVIENIPKPIMVSDVYEQDYYVKEGDDYVLKGASFAIILDPRDQDDNRLTKAMSQTTIKEYGEKIIPILHSYLRTKEEFDGLPLNICVYRATNNIDSQHDGAYILQSYSENELGGISAINQQTILFSSEEAETKDNIMYTDFATYKNTLKNFSTDAVNVVGYGEYLDDELQSFRMEIVVNTKTYGEINYFTSKVIESLDNYPFAKIIPIQVLIKTDSNDVYAMLKKEVGQQVVPIVN